MTNRLLFLCRITFMLCYGSIRSPENFLPYAVFVAAVAGKLAADGGKVIAAGGDEISFYLLFIIQL